MTACDGVTQLLVVVVHYGPPEPTTEIATSLWRQGVRVVVIANDLSARPPTLVAGVEWFVPDRNLGYGEAFNVAIGTRVARSYLLLNNDVRLSAATLQRCLEVLNHEKVGIVGPVLLKADGSLQSGAARLTRWLRRPQVLIDPNQRVEGCEWVTGAVMFIRDEVARQVGMDGSYFLGAEDADLCVRARRAGWQVLCCGDAPAEHTGSQVISGPRWYYYATRNRVWWTRENFGLTSATLNWLSLALALPRVFAADALRRRSLTCSRLMILALAHAWWRKPDRLQGPLDGEPLPSKVMDW